MRSSVRRTAFCLLLACLPGCSQLTTEQRAWLQQGQHAHDQGDYAFAIDRMSRFLSAAADKPGAGRALYIRGLANARAGRRAMAYADLQAAAAGADPDAAWHAHFALAELAYEDERWSGATQAYAAAVGAMPPAPPMDRGLYRLGVASQRMGEWQESYRWLERLVRQFTGSSLAPAARRILDVRPGAFSIQCGAFGRSNNGEDRRVSLQRQGVAAFVRPERRDGRTLYVVYSGRYRTYDQARHGLAQVQRLVPDALIWP
jgi:tetratricopeptide (TPR) repeat protein